MRGNWPLVPTMDVVVPHTRTMADMFEVLDVIVADDPQTRGDFWREQPWVDIPKASEVRPQCYPALAYGPWKCVGGKAVRCAADVCERRPRGRHRRAPGHRRCDGAAH